MSNPTNINLDLGKNIMEVRKRHSMSIKALAEAAGVTSSLLSQIERGIANPSISTMKAISDALQVPLYDFFLPTVDNTNKLISRANSRERFIFPSAADVERPDGYECERLTPKYPSEITLLRTKLPPKSASSTAARTHAEDEAAYVESGTVFLQLGDTREELYTHDSASIPAKVPHRWINETDEDVYLILASSKKVE